MQLQPFLTGSARLFLYYLFLTGSIALYGQQSSGKTHQLEALFTHQDYPLTDMLTVNRSNGTSTFTSIEATPRFGMGASVRAVNEQGWYSRYGVVNLSLNRSVDFIVTTIRDINPISSVSGTRNSLFNLQLRYERGRYFKAGKNFTFGLGVMFDPVITRRKSEVLDPLDFPAKLTAIRLDVGVVPSIAVHLTQRVSLVLEAPLPLIRTSFTHRYSDNPFLLAENRRESTFDTDFFSRIFQVGAGVRYQL